MSSFVALLRAVNLGGTNKLPMDDLRRLCEAAGFEGVETYIASGNAVFSSPRTSSEVKASLEMALAAHAGKPVGVFVRTAEEMAMVLANNPFRETAPNRTVVIFLQEAPPPDAISEASGVNGEKMILGSREIYVHYGEGMRETKLKIPAAKSGTARNLNTVSKLAVMAAAR